MVKQLSHQNMTHRQRERGGEGGRERGRGGRERERGELHLRYTHTNSFHVISRLTMWSSSSRKSDSAEGSDGLSEPSLPST